MHSCCFSVSGMGIGGPGLQIQWFITVPYRVSCWSHLLLPLKRFSVPEWEMFATLALQRGSTSSIQLSSPGCLSPVHPMLATEEHESVQKRSGWKLSWTTPMNALSSPQPNYSLQTEDREREIHQCALHIPNCALSTHLLILSPSFPFPGIENRHSVSSSDTLWRDFYLKSNMQKMIEGKRCKQKKSACSLSCCFMFGTIQRRTGGHCFHR